MRKGFEIKKIMLKREEIVEIVEGERIIREWGGV